MPQTVNSVDHVDDLVYSSSSSSANITSSLVLNGATSHTNGAFIGGSFATNKPLRITSFGVRFNTITSPPGTVQIKLATTASTSNDLYAAPTTFTGPNTISAQVPFPLPRNANDTIHYGYRKQDSNTVRVRRSDLVPVLNTDGIFNGSTRVSNGQMSGFIVTTSAPSAPTNFQLTDITHSTASFSWGLPTDEGGGSESVNGYRILYNNGIAWQASDFISGRLTNTYTLVGLQPNTSYTFLIAATNTVTSSHGGSGTAQTTGPNTATGGTTLKPVRQIWNGTSFVSGGLRVWNGTSFVSTTANSRMWNGTSWIDSKP